MKLYTHSVTTVQLKYILILIFLYFQIEEPRTMPNPFQYSAIKADPIYMNGGPVYDDSSEEMINIPEMLRSMDFTVVRFGAVIVRPPDACEGHSSGQLSPKWSNVAIRDSRIRRLNWLQSHDKDQTLHPSSTIAKKSMAS